MPFRRVAKTLTTERRKKYDGFFDPAGATPHG
jgi:hypothetical protein